MSRQPALRLRRRRGRREAVAAHDCHHLHAIWRSTGARAHHLGGLAKILRTERGRCDQAEHLGVLAAAVVEAMNRATTNADRLSWPDVEGGPVDSPGQHPSDSVD